MWRNVVRLCAPWLLGAAALAQSAPSDPATILSNQEKQTGPLAQSWLHSPDPRYQAWGAYLVLRDRHTEAIPDLLNLLSAFQVAQPPVTTAEIDHHYAMCDVLDALIQLNVQVPVEDARRIYPEFRVQSLILLSHSTEDPAPALLDVFKTEQILPAAWLAAGNLLVHRGVPGFIAAVLEGMTVHAEVNVTEPNANFVRGGSSSCSGTGPTAGPIAGWPPLAGYEFGGCGARVEPDATILAAGTDPAYYHRQVTATYQLTGIGGCGCRLDQDLARQHYLAELPGYSQDRPPLRARVSQTIVWHGPDAYLSELSTFISDQQRQFAELVLRLRSQNRLSEDEASTLRPRLDLRIFDMRSSPDTVLPALSPLPDGVTVGSY